MDTLTQVVQHPLFGVISLVVGVLSLLLGYVFFRLSRRIKQPYWTINSNNLISGFSGKVHNLEIKYSDRKIENLTISQIVFWNAGSQTIHRTDIAAADPLKIVAANGIQLLDAKLLKANSEPSRFLVSKESSQTAAFLHFDFLDKNQGAVIQVVHTGTSSKDLLLVGTIKGAGSPIRKNVRIYKSRGEFLGNQLILLLLMPFYLWFGLRAFKDSLYENGGLGLALFMLAGFLVNALALWVAFVHRIPRGLEVYAEGL